MLLDQILAFTIHKRKNIKKSTKRTNLKYQPEHELINLSYLNDNIFCIRCSGLFWLNYEKKHESVAYNPPIRIYKQNCK